MDSTTVEAEIFPDEKFVSETEVKPPIQTIQPIATKSVCADTTDYQTLAVPTTATGRVVRLVTRRGNNERVRVIIGVVSGPIVLLSSESMPNISSFLDMAGAAVNVVSNGVILQTGDTYVHQSGDEIFAVAIDAVNLDRNGIVNIIEDASFKEV